MIIQLITFVDLSNRIWFKNVDNSYILKSSNTCTLKLALEASYSTPIIWTGIAIIHRNSYNHISYNHILMKNKLLIDNWTIDGQLNKLMVTILDK